MWFWIRVFVLVCIIPPLTFAQSERQNNPAAEWQTYNHDLAGTRYSPLTQINTSNVARLTQAWTYRPAASGARRPVSGAGCGVSPRNRS